MKPNGNTAIDSLYKLPLKNKETGDGKACNRKRKKEKSREETDGGKAKNIKETLQLIHFTKHHQKAKEQPTEELAIKNVQINPKPTQHTNTFSLQNTIIQLVPNEQQLNIGKKSRVKSTAHRPGRGREKKSRSTQTQVKRGRLARH